jgi:hypothetical protein
MRFEARRPRGQLDRMHHGANNRELFPGVRGRSSPEERRAALPGDRSFVGSSGVSRPHATHDDLILTQKGGPFEPSVKRRVNFAGETVEYLAADSLQSSHEPVSSRRLSCWLQQSFGSAHLRAACWHKATRSKRCNCCSVTHLDHVLPYLAVSDRRLRQMFCDVL